MLEVPDEYRTSPLSHQPGGYHVELIYELHTRISVTPKLQSLGYDKIKSPYMYIKKVISQNNQEKTLREARVEGESKYRQGDPTSPWKFK